MSEPRDRPDRILLRSGDAAFEAADATAKRMWLAIGEPGDMVSGVVAHAAIQIFLSHFVINCIDDSKIDLFLSDTAAAVKRLVEQLRAGGVQ